MKRWAQMSSIPFDVGRLIGLQSWLRWRLNCLEVLAEHLLFLPQGRVADAERASNC